MPEWRTRLAVKYKAGNGTPQYVTPIDSFSPTFALNAEPLHSLERTHVGVVYNPVGVTFSMSVRATGPAAAQLTVLAMAGTEFDLVMQEEEGDDWSFDTVVLAKCTITSAAPSNAAVAGIPTATFSGFSRGAAVAPAGQPEPVKIGRA
jgi:hypothetical protein